MDYIEKLDLQTEEIEEVETLEKHKIIISEPFSVNKYKGHTDDFLAVDGEYDDGFNQLKETDGLGISCIVSKKVKEAREEVNDIKSSLDNITTYLTPEMFGAKGDGKTDDYNALQTTINKCYELGIYEIKFKSLWYYTSKTLRTKNSVNSGGEGIFFNGNSLNTILSRSKKSDKLPLDNISASDDINVLVNEPVLAIHSNRNKIENIKFMYSKCAIYLGQDPRYPESRTHCHYNKFNNIYSQYCGTGIVFRDGYGCYYNNFSEFRITEGTIGIDMRCDYQGNIANGGVCNRNDFYSGEISKQFCGVAIINGDTNTVDTIHFEGIGIGYGTKPSWLPDNIETAIYSGYQDNTFINCVCEGNNRDVYDDGYGNNFINNTINFYKGKVKFAKPNTLGTVVGRSAGGTSNCFNNAGIFYQVPNENTNKGSVNEDLPSWVTVLKGEVQDTNYGLKNYDFTQENISNENFLKSVTSDSKFYHKKVCGINYIWLKVAFLCNEGMEEEEYLKIKLPYKINDELDIYAVRSGLRIVGYCGNEIIQGYLRDNELWVKKPSDNWSSTVGAERNLDFQFNYF